MEKDCFIIAEWIDKNKKVYKMKVIDCVCFLQEIDLLKARLELLQDAVDITLVVESNTTFSGKPKPYNLDSRIREFDQWHEKLMYMMIDQSDSDVEIKEVSKYTPENGSWLLEHQHRNSFALVRDIVEDDDIVLIGDLDEVPYPEAIEILKTLPDSYFPVSLNMLFHYYYVNCQNIGFERQWNGTVAVKGKQFKEELPQTFRDGRNKYDMIANAGNHWSFLGDADKIKNKIQSFAHTEFNKPEIISEDHILDCIENGKDVFNRAGVSYKVVPMGTYPAAVQKVFSKYPQFIKEV